jgi:hypothetical protein
MAEQFECSATPMRPQNLVKITKCIAVITRIINTCRNVIELVEGISINDIEIT